VEEVPLNQWGRGTGGGRVSESVLSRHLHPSYHLNPPAHFVSRVPTANDSSESSPNTIFHQR